LRMEQTSFRCWVWG